MDPISSGITIGALAANIAISLVKPKSCWDMIQDVPEDVQNLVKRVELISVILHDIEDE